MKHYTKQELEVLGQIFTDVMEHDYQILVGEFGITKVQQDFLDELYKKVNSNLSKEENIMRKLYKTSYENEAYVYEAELIALSKAEALEILKKSFNWTETLEEKDLEEICGTDSEHSYVVHDSFYEN